MLAASVNHYLCPPQVSCLAFVEQAREHGYAGVGITAAALREIPAAQLRKELAARGMRASSVNSAGFFLERNFETGQASLNTQLLRDAAELGAPLNVIVGGSTLLPLAEARARATAGLHDFACEAEHAGVPLLLEPLHPFHARGMSCLNSLAQLESVFAHIPGLMLNADLFHLWWDPDLERVLRGDGVAIGLLQVSDVAQQTAGATMPQRVPLGEGFLDWRACVRHVLRAFPQAQVELELFANQLPGRALDELLRTNASALQDFFLGERHGDRPD